MATIKGILILTPFFSPNIGGVETHLDDLVDELNHHHINSYVLTYSPLTSNKKYQRIENKKYSRIFRFKWFGYQLFPKLEKYPILDFLYLTPYLLIRSYIWLLFNHQKISLIHSHGFNAAFIGNILSKLFRIPHLCSTHAIYENINGLSQKITVWQLKKCQQILCLSQKSKYQLINWGVNPKKLSLYHHWINLKKFTEIPVKNKKFNVLYVGRLIPKKGIKLFIKVAKKLPKINFIIVGGGQLQNYVMAQCQKNNNLSYIGEINNQDLPSIYQKSSIFAITSQYPEGFGRTPLEALACGLPILGSNLGAIPEALDDSVSILFKPTLKNFVSNIKTISQNKKLYKKLQNNTRRYAIKNFSSKNFNVILQAYYKLLNKD